MDGDGKVRWNDVWAVWRHIGKKRFNSKYDLNGDGRVTGRDLQIAVWQVGRRCDR
jgi:hypothetical protein